MNDLVDLWACVLDFVTDVRDLEQVRQVCRVFCDLSHRKARFRKKRFYRLAMKRACKTGDLDAVTFLHELRPNLQEVTRQLCGKYCMRHDTCGAELVPQVHDHLSDIDDQEQRRCLQDSLNAAAAEGHLNVLQWLRDRVKLRCTPNAISLAVTNGHLDVLRWLKANGCEFPRSGVQHIQGGLVALQCWHELWVPNARQLQFVGSLAAITGQLAVAKWVYSLGVEFPTQNDLNSAFHRGHLETVLWMQQVGNLRVNLRQVVIALTCKKLDIVDWWYATNSEKTAVSNRWAWDALEAVVCSGNLEYLQKQISRSPGVRIRTVALRGCAKKGFVATLRWLHSNSELLVEPTSWMEDPNIMNGAASRGHLELVEWLHSIGASCTTKAMDKAAKNGHLSTVRWLHARRDEGCTADAMDCAANNGHYDVVVWLHERRTEGCVRAKDYAAASGHDRVLRWLCRNRSEVCTPEAARLAARSGHLTVLRILLEHGLIESDTQSFVAAAGNGQSDVVKWLFAHAPDLSANTYQEAFLHAIGSGYLKVGKLLHRLKPEWIVPIFQTPELYPRQNNPDRTVARIRRLRHILNLSTQ